jgi:SAM-dependent methyltransferase
MLKRIYSVISNKLFLAYEKMKPGTEFNKATQFWGSLDSYHLTNDTDPISIARSQWISKQIIPLIHPRRFLEIGCNSGRNLYYLQMDYPKMVLRGIDVNQRAIDFAKSTKPNISFELSDAHNWTQPKDSWDCALTMSVIDHIPEDASRILARNIASSCRAVIGVELWDGSNGERALYKYSINLKELYESVGFTTIRWEQVPQELQYDSEKSLLWVYVGQRH